MSRLITFSIMALLLAIMCFAAWKVLHIAPAATDEIPSAAVSALEHPTAMTIASIRKAELTGPQIGGYAVVQSATVTDQKLREQCALTLLACVSDVGQSPECFDPSLAIQVSNATGDYTFLPCFKCGHMKVIQKLTGHAEEWSWVEIRANGHEFDGLYQSIHLTPPPAS